MSRKLAETVSPSEVSSEDPSPSPLQIDAERLPKHLAVIMDGNGRWAAARGQPVMAGHDAGAKALRIVADCCASWGIPYLTVYAFSTENWQRGSDEISFLFGLMERVLREELASLADRGVRLRFLGDTARLPANLRGAMERAEALTADNAALNFNIAISYSSRQDLAAAARAIAEKVAAGELDPSQVDEACVSSHLTTSQLPPGVRDPDLVIRTSGEQRLSNFLLWEAAYSELYFSPVYWPDFGEAQLREALQEYATRDRRYGKRKVSKTTLAQRATPATQPAVRCQDEAPLRQPSAVHLANGGGKGPSAAATLVADGSSMTSGCHVNGALLTQ